MRRQAGEDVKIDANADDRIGEFYKPLLEAAKNAEPPAVAEVEVDDLPLDPSIAEPENSLSSNEEPTNNDSTTEPTETSGN